MSGTGGDISSRTCFVARPLSISEELAAHYGDDRHWDHVEEYLIVPALEKTGYVHLSTAAEGAVLIHEHVIEKVYNADLMIADFSQLNANVLFEAGVRTSVNKPLLVIAERGTELPFDMNGVNTWFYDPSLRPWDIEQSVTKLVDHIDKTNPEGNALWTKFGALLKAEELAGGSAEDASVVLLGQISSQLQQLWDAQRNTDDGRHRSIPLADEHARIAEEQNLGATRRGLALAAAALTDRMEAAKLPDSTMAQVKAKLVRIMGELSEDGLVLGLEAQEKDLFDLELMLGPDFQTEIQTFRRAWSRHHHAQGGPKIWSSPRKFG